MKSKIALSIDKPCTANWQDMTTIGQGKFCDSCQKQVVDFTQLSDSQIRSYFLQHKGKVCGRFHQNQLKQYSIGINRPAVYSVFTLLGLSLATLPVQAHIPEDNQLVQLQPQSSHAVTDTVVRTQAAYKVVGYVQEANTAAPLPGVSIFLKGTNTGATSDAAGKFEIELKEKPATPLVLVYAFIGYNRVEKEIQLKEQPQLDTGVVALQVDDRALLGEVVIVQQNSWRSLWWRINNVFR